MNYYAKDYISNSRAVETTRISADLFASINDSIKTINKYFEIVFRIDYRYVDAETATCECISS